MLLRGSPVPGGRCAGSAGGTPATGTSSTDADHARLADLLQGIAGVAVVSGYDCPLYEALYTRRGWGLVRLQATDQAGGRRTECLWLHPRCAAPDPPRTRP